MTCPAAEAPVFVLMAAIAGGARSQMGKLRHWEAEEGAKGTWKGCWSTWLPRDPSPRRRFCSPQRPVAAWAGHLG